MKIYAVFSIYTLDQPLTIYIYWGYGILLKIKRNNSKEPFSVSRALVEYDKKRNMLSVHVRDSEEVPINLFCR